MDVRLLEAFRAVVDHRSVTGRGRRHGRDAARRQRADRAARAGASASRCSSAAGGRLKPTPEGLLFYAEASACWASSTACAGRHGADPRRPGRPARHRQPSAAPPSRCCPRWSPTFWPTRPGVSVRLLSRHSDVVSQLLPTRKLRHRHRRAAGRRDRGAADALPACAASAILPPRHPLAARKLLTPALLSGHPWWRRRARCRLPRRARRHLRRRRRAAQHRRRGRILRQPVRPGGGRRRLVARRSAVGARASAISAWWCGRSSRRSSTRSASSTAATASPRCWPQPSSTLLRGQARQPAMT